MSVGVQRLRDDAETVRRGAIDKGEDASLVDRALELDAERRRLQAEADGLRAELKAKSAAVGQALKGGGDADTLRAEARELGERIAERQARFEQVEREV